MRSLHQERKRWAAVDVETLTSHFATLEALISEHSIDVSRLCNLDKNEGTPEEVCKWQHKGSSLRNMKYPIRYAST